MTNNKLTNEQLNAAVEFVQDRYNAAKENGQLLMTDESIILSALRELQEYRKAASQSVVWIGLDPAKDCGGHDAVLNQAPVKQPSSISDLSQAIDQLRNRAADELDSGCRAHHNALIYAANVLENVQAFGGGA